MGKGHSFGESKYKKMPIPFRLSRKYAISMLQLKRKQETMRKRKIREKSQKKCELAKSLKKNSYFHNAFDNSLLPNLRPFYATCIKQSKKHCVNAKFSEKSYENVN